MWDEKNKNMRVLLVEDAPFLRYAFGRLLRMHGFEVMEANDGHEALECVSKFQPQLVVTDLMMPVMGGAELIARLRADPETASIPIVVISGERGVVSHVADAVFAKPFISSELLEAVRCLAGG
jgi:CheY-like chemotaxis protein